MRMLPLGLAALLLAGCAPATPTAGPTPDAGLTDWSTNLAGSAATPQLTGAVSARSGAGQTSVAISLAGALPGARHPWHVHAGRCGSGGSIIGDPAAYPPLPAAGDGRATAQARLAVALDPAAEYHVNVHASPTDMATIVACGNLAR